MEARAEEQDTLPASLLPSLEYGLPVDSADTRQGWIEVQKALNRSGRYRGTPNGFPDQATFQSLLAYLSPLGMKLVERARQAEHQAETAAQTTGDATSGWRYAKWEREEPYAIYWGELFFPDQKASAPSEAGYTAEARSGWPNSYFYYGPGRGIAAPLCEAYAVGDAASYDLFTCVMIGGRVTVSVQQMRNEVRFSRSGDEDMVFSFGK